MHFIKNQSFFLFIGIFLLLVVIGSFAYKWYINSIIGNSYQVIQTNKLYEVRLYDPYLVAQTNINTSDFSDGGREGFNILAGYIFGGNTSQIEMPMTSPVLDKVQNEKIPMTSPVLDKISDEGLRTFSFILPKNQTLQTAPIPNDSRVLIKEIPAKKVAVISFSGYWNQAKFDKKLGVLRDALKEKNISFSSNYTRASYDPPFTPWFLRKNEIHIEIGESTNG